MSSHMNHMMWLSIRYDISVTFIHEKKACRIFFSNSSRKHTTRKNSSW